jgi:emopamil binding protein
MRLKLIDLAIVAFFALNLVFVAYGVDLENVVIADPAHFRYPAWPLPPVVDAIHWWGRNFDPLVLARPVWWRALIWIEVLLYGPFYAAAVYAFLLRRDWIRIPSIMWATAMLMSVSVVLSEETLGPLRSPEPIAVWGANAAFIVFPLLVLGRMVPAERPFSRLRAR